jgi:hypothetical protein
MTDADVTTSPLFSDLLGGGQEELTDDQKRNLLKQVASLLGSGSMTGGLGDSNPYPADPFRTVPQVAALTGTGGAQRPVLGPSSNGIRYLFLGGSPIPPDPNATKAAEQAARTALVANSMDALRRTVGSFTGSEQQSMDQNKLLALMALARTGWWLLPPLNSGAY